MAERRKCELYLLRLVPHPLRDDFMTVGVVLVEDGSRQPSAGSGQEKPQPSKSGAGGAPGHQLSADDSQESPHPPQKTRKGGAPGSAVIPGHRMEDSPGLAFADVRFTKDWKRVECFAPEIEAEILERLEAGVRGGLREIRRREDLLQLVERGFGSMIDVGPVKAVETWDPAREMEVIARDYLAPMRAETERARRMGRMGIVSRMQDAFAEAGVLELLQRDIEMTEFTGENDPFKVDFGFRVGSSLKMFHALALSLSREPAVTLAYRFSRVQEGMRKRQEEALLTAIISEEAMKIPTLPQKARQGWGTQARWEVASGMAMLQENGIRVRGLEEMGELAEEVRRELQK